ncbi:substrate-binding and vWA domain-containing protein [Streptomyces antarcticus]|uniref:substrate-binding and vWA domain-containing protein n=1 Tax=Streptomyces antarcticus TaxID=2996458 RepID=UPI00227079FD|nr:MULTISPECIES: VWA domain-containing protein [unclassified Streptomyces]MCY0940731.1 VWA domain-containing protein [Streptomyces sp. H34-AA3]MCZ4082002.1 VWA domain-containing protein [Streptomyces sp. H34-S5]
MSPSRPGGRLRRAPLARVLALVALVAASACTSSSPAGPGGSEGPGGSKPTAYKEGTLRVLASSELADMQPVLDRAKKATGVTVKLTWSGTLDAVEQVASGKADGAYDAIWLSSNDYLRLRPEAAGKLANETPVMSSPVALGVKPQALARLGWQPGDVTWSAVHEAVAAGKLTYGMTDPVRSNSGFSALVSVASGLSGAQSALTDADVKAAAPRLKEFFAGQKLTSGSSGWLATAYAKRGDVDALVNYESVLLSANRDAQAGLTVVRPRDGVVTAHYPLTLLTAAPAGARESGRALTEWLRGPEAQQAITERTLRRPVAAGVAPAAGLDAEKRRELPFPGSRSVADGLLASYENELRRPSRTVYVLDTSGSMAEEDRIGRLKAALTELTGSGSSGPGQRFRDREEVTLLPFGDKVKKVLTHVVEPGDPGASLDAIRADVRALQPAGGTAVYGSLKAAYQHLGREDADAFTSIVLMTDGRSGDKAKDFDAFYAALPEAGKRTPVFAVLFGDSDRAELAHITELTGGRLFDATDGNGSLDGAFEEIRGYQ